MPNVVDQAPNTTVTRSVVYESISGIGWVDEQSHDPRCGDQLVQQLQPFWRHLHVRLGHARNIAARLIKAGDEVELHRIADGGEDNGNRSVRRLCRERRRSGSRGNYGHFDDEPDQTP
jgi:hypothetical protein